MNEILQEELQEIDMEKEQEISLAEQFDNLLLSTKREGIEKLIKYLHCTDFYTAPASTKYHDSCPSGLLHHSLTVYKNLENMLSMYIEQGLIQEDEIKPESRIIAALLHDICKSNFYKESVRNVKNQDTGMWEQVPFYSVEDLMPLGHGEKSVIIAQYYIQLYGSEMLAIRWHMGGFDDSVLSFSGRQTISAAFRKSKLLLLLHLTDMASTYIAEKSIAIA